MARPTLRDALVDILLEATSEPALSRFVGRCADLQLPRPVLRMLVAAYARALDVDLGEAVVPPGGFRNFDDFFTRQLRPGLRPLAPGQRRLVSPVDGTLARYGAIEDGQLLQVKGKTYDLAALLDDAELARRFDGGTYFTLYLSPRDYHRIHAPADGHILGYHYIPGRLFPVNRLGVERVPGLFPRNERLVTLMKTPLGQMAVVKVGATSVGRISVSYADLRTNEGGNARHAVLFARPKEIAKGADLGAFHLGSTVVLLVQPPGLRLDESLWDGRAVRVGEPLADRA